MDEKRQPNTLKHKKGAERVKQKTSSKKTGEAQKKLKAAEAEIESLKDRLLRTAAELDNIRKRTEREIAQIIRMANEGLIKDILPVVDDIERSLKTEPKTGKAKELHKGVDLIYQKLVSILEKYGLQSMESTGQAFDVDRHDAVLQVEAKDTPAGIVVEEHEKGYLLNDKVIRHAKVIVSK